MKSLHRLVLTAEKWAQKIRAFISQQVISSHTLPQQTKKEMASGGSTMGRAREPLLNGKTQYSGPPCINQFGSAHFHFFDSLLPTCKGILKGRVLLPYPQIPNLPKKVANRDYFDFIYARSSMVIKSSCPCLHFMFLSYDLY